MLNGKVVIVPLGVDGPALARRLAAGGATVLVVAGEAEAEGAGRLAAEIEAAGAGGGGPAGLRGQNAVAVFVAGPGDGLDPLVDYVAELFRT